MNRYVCVAAFLLTGILPSSHALADSTNSAFGIMVFHPGSFVFSQRDSPARTICLSRKIGEQIVIRITAAGIMQPEALAQLTLDAFRKGRSLRKVQGDLSEREISRTILGETRTGTQVRETFPSGLHWSEFYSFKHGDRMYLVSMQWDGSIEKGLPLEFGTIIELMKESSS
jgi:hypothetical protein